MHCERKGVESYQQKVDHLAYTARCTARFWNHQNDKKFDPVLVEVTSTAQTRGIKMRPTFLSCYMSYLEYEGIWRAMLFREHFFSDVLPHFHYNNENAHKLLFTSPQNSTFSLKQRHTVSHQVFHSDHRRLVNNQLKSHIIQTFLK